MDGGGEHEEEKKGDDDDKVFVKVEQMEEDHVDKVGGIKFVPQVPGKSAEEEEKARIQLELDQKVQLATLRAREAMTHALLVEQFARLGTNVPHPIVMMCPPVPDGDLLKRGQEVLRDLRAWTAKTGGVGGEDHPVPGERHPPFLVYSTLERTQ